MPCSAPYLPHHTHHTSPVITIGDSRDYLIDLFEELGDWTESEGFDFHYLNPSVERDFLVRSSDNSF